MTTKELIHIAKSIGATEITDNTVADTITNDVTICSTSGTYGATSILFKATNGNYYYIGKRYGFIYKFI